MKSLFVEIFAYNLQRTELYELDKIKAGSSPILCKEGLICFGDFEGTEAELMKGKLKNQKRIGYGKMKERNCLEKRRAVVFL